MRRASLLSALRYREFRLLWLGLLVANVGAWMQTYALGWYVVQLALREGVPERAPLYLGVVSASRAVPILLVGIVAGTVADRVDRRRLLLITHSASGAVTLSLAGLALSDHLGLAQLIVASALGGLTAAFDSPARLGIVAGLVPAALIGGAIGLTQSTLHLATVIGPLVGGLLISPIGVAGVLLFNSASYVVIIGAVLLMRPVERVPVLPGTGFLDSMLEGFRYVWRDPVIGPLFLVLLAVSLFVRPLTQLMPAFTGGGLHVGPVELSWLLAGAGAGALGGALITGALVGRTRPGVVACLAGAASGVMVLALGMQESLPAAIVLAFLASLAMQVQVTNHVTVYQLRTPAGLRGRVVGLSSTVAQSSIAIGALLVGAVGTATGIQVALGLAGGVVIVACVALLLRFPTLRSLVV